jgi:asparagine synthase (glutamine-hydrolysing)
MALPDIAQRVLDQRLTYLGAAKLEALCDAAAAVKAQGVPGDFVEFGVALGGSGICLASALDQARRFIGFDVFGMIPPPTEADGPRPAQRYADIVAGKSRGLKGDPYYGYVADLYRQVAASFAAFGVPLDGVRVRLVRGLFAETLPLMPPHAIALAHIDCDWHDPVALCLAHVHRNLSPGGLVVLDDYHFWPGAQAATDAFLATHPDMAIIQREPQLVLRKA